MLEDHPTSKSGPLTQEGSNSSDMSVNISSTKKERLSMFMVLKIMRTETSLFIINTTE
jgi:hypothetical protein